MKICVAEHFEDESLNLDKHHSELTFGIGGVVKYLNTQVFKYYLNTVKI